MIEAENYVLAAFVGALAFVSTISPATPPPKTLDPATQINAWAWARAPHVCRAHNPRDVPEGILVNYERQRVEIICDDGYSALLPFPFVYHASALSAPSDPT